MYNKNMMQEEKVLVIERKVLEKVGIFQGIMHNIHQYLQAIFSPGVPHFMLRSKAESDSNFKQIIPYVIMSHNKKYLNYVRGKRGDERRLVEKRSIGIGGHINPIDMKYSSEGSFETYLNAVHREVEEEVSVETKYKDRIVGLLNDDSNDVGSVHLGIVHLWLLDEPNVYQKEQMITQISFLDKNELQKLKNTMETWSQLCLDHLILNR